MEAILVEEGPMDLDLLALHENDNLPISDEKEDDLLSIEFLSIEFLVEDEKIFDKVDIDKENLNLDTPILGDDPGDGLKLNFPYAATDSDNLEDGDVL